MAKSFEYKALLECFDSLVTALKFDPASLAVELAAKGLVPPGDVTNQRSCADQARELAGRILNRVELAPNRYHDIVKIFSRHLWMDDFVKILDTAYYNDTSIYTTAAHVETALVEIDGSKHESTAHDNKTACEFSCDLGEIPRCKPSFKVANPVVRFSDLEEDDLEDLYDQIDELTKKIKLEFRKLFDMVFVSYRDSQEIDHDRLVLTLINCEENLFKEDELAGTKSVYDVFRIIKSYCSYFNYDVLETLIETNGSPQAKGCLKKYLQDFAAYCKAIPCAESICGSEDARRKRAKLKFKLDFDRQQLKPDAVRSIKCKIAKHLGVRSSALYLCRIEEGCISLTFLVPTFITGLLLSLSNAQKIALREDVKTFENFHLVQDIKFEIKPLLELETTIGKELEPKLALPTRNDVDIELSRNEVRSPQKVFDWFRRFTLSRSGGNGSDHLHSDIETTLSAEAAISCPHAAESSKAQKRKNHLGTAIRRVFSKVKKNKKRSGADSGYSSKSSSVQSAQHQHVDICMLPRQHDPGQYDNHELCSQLGTQVSANDIDCAGLVQSAQHQPAIDICMLPRQYDSGQYAYYDDIDENEFKPVQPAPRLPECSGTTDSGYNSQAVTMTIAKPISAPPLAYESLTRVLNDVLSILQTKTLDHESHKDREPAQNNSPDFGSHGLYSSSGSIYLGSESSQEYNDDCTCGHVGAAIKEKIMEDSIDASDDEGIEDEHSII